MERVAIDRESSEAVLLSRARQRRLDRMEGRGRGAARPACLACLILALVWVLGLWQDLPGWAVAGVVVGVVGLVALASALVRGRRVVG